MIYFVRHGSTDWNDFVNENGKIDPKCQGLKDLALNNHGLEQAYKLRETLKDVKFDRVLSSPLLRARQTCEIICNKNYKIETDLRLIERDFGEFEGLTRKEFDFTDFWNINSKTKYTKAETISSVEKRVFNLLDELSKNPNQNVLIVSHGGVGLVFMSYFFGIPKNSNYISFELGHGGYRCFDFNQKINQQNI